MRSWHAVQEICKMKSKNEIVRVEDEIVTPPISLLFCLGLITLLEQIGFFYSAL